MASWIASNYLQPLKILQTEPGAKRTGGNEALMIFQQNVFCAVYGFGSQTQKNAREVIQGTRPPSALTLVANEARAGRNAAAAAALGRGGEGVGGPAFSRRSHNYA